MQTVTFETAKRLKEAGFSQPERWNPGQVWFEENMYAPSPYFFIWSDCIPGCGDEIRFFAPTATDLIPPGWFLYRENEDSGMERWACGSDSEVEHFHDNNPAEAAALAWLHVNRNFSNV